VTRIPATSEWAIVPGPGDEGTLAKGDHERIELRGRWRRDGDEAGCHGDRRAAVHRR
jgi:hypothetical protein